MVQLFKLLEFYMYQNKIFPKFKIFYLSTLPLIKPFYASIFGGGGCGDNTLPYCQFLSLNKPLNVEMKIREKYEAKALKTFIGYDMNN